MCGALTIAAVTAACGQTDPPTPEQVKEGMQYFEYNDVKAANGEPLRCVLYGSESSMSNDSKSWFGLSCDFAGTAYFPGEPMNVIANETTASRPR